MTPRFRRLTLALLSGDFVALSSCMDEERLQNVELIHADAWALAEPGADTFAALRPSTSTCDVERGLAQESDGYEINTAWCNYATISQPILAPVVAGDTVDIRGWHFDLTGAEATAYVGVALDGEILWTEDIPIPSDSGVIRGSFEVPRDVELGAPIQFHVHNHGSNTWKIISLVRL